MMTVGDPDTPLVPIKSQNAVTLSSEEARHHMVGHPQMEDGRSIGVAAGPACQPAGASDLVVERVGGWLGHGEVFMGGGWDAQ